jgi:hypothetical protein
MHSGIMKRAFCACLIALAASCGGGGSGSPPPPPPPPAAPTAAAGPDAIVNKFSTVALGSTGTTNASTYEWTQLSGPSAVIKSANTATAIFQARSLGAYDFRLRVTGPGGAAEDTVRITVQDEPVLRLLAPTGGEDFQTISSSVDVGVQTGATITTVQLVNLATNATFNASPVTQRADFSGIALNLGDNTLQVTARDQIGATTISTLLVTRTSGVTFLGNPSFSDVLGLTGAPVQVVVRIPLQGAGTAAGSVQLVEVNSSGAVVSTVGNLADTGNVGAGDDIPADGVYSGIFTFNSATPKISTYRIQARDGLSAASLSGRIDFSFVAPVTAAEFAAVQTTFNASVAKEFTSAPRTLTPSQFESAKDNIVADLKLSSSVATAVLTEDGNAVVAVFKNGVTHIIDLQPNSGVVEKGGPRNRQSTFRAPDPTVRLFGATQKASTKTTAGLSTKAVASGQNVIGSLLAIGLGPYQDEFGANDDTQTVWPNVIVPSITPQFQADPVEVNDDATIEDFKRLSNYGLILISSHGTWVGYRDASGAKCTPEKSNPTACRLIGGVIQVREAVTDARKLQYREDLASGRLVFMQGSNIRISNGSIVANATGDASWTFGVTGQFIREYNGTFPNSLVFLSICSGLADESLGEASLARAFTGKGAGAVVGFTGGKVNPVYAQKTNSRVMQEMVAGKKLSEAIDAARATFGEFDDVATPASLAFRGSADLELQAISIVNGGFEFGSTGWTKAGDVRVQPQLHTLKPTEGALMGVISTGLGSVNDSDSSVYQEFTVPTTATTLSITYNVVSEEPLEFVGQGFDDKFEVRLFSGAAFATNQLVVSEAVDTSTWLAIQGPSSGDGGLFPDGDDTAYHTGFKTRTFDVTDLQGERVRLQLRVFDIGDSFFDTAALLDAIRAN